MESDGITAVRDTKTGPLDVLPGDLRLGPVHLTVTRLDRALQFYCGALGLHLHQRDGQAAVLGDGRTAVLVLVAEADARSDRGHAGLYHVALLAPSRHELARMAARLVQARVAIQGASDHFTHEAIYLPDPDGNGLEIAADRPEGSWPPAEKVMSRIDPLDLRALVGTIAGEPIGAHVAEGLRVGHVHLHVADVERGVAFYRDVLGFGVWGRMDSAAFLAAGRYHHHVGINVWRGPWVQPAESGTLGLRHWTIELPDAPSVAQLRSRLAAAGAPVREDAVGFWTADPWGIAVRVDSFGS